MPFEQLVEDLGYWSQGIIQAGRKTGPAALINALLDESGDPYRRGGSIYKSNASFGSSGLRFLWDGLLAGGRRTVSADPTGLFQLGSDDATPVSFYSAAGLTVPVGATHSNGMLAIEGLPIFFAGSRKSADYGVGTVDLTKDSRTVVGHGTSWLANADAGMILLRPGHVYPVQSIDDNTHLTLQVPFQETTVAGASYSLARYITVPNAPEAGFTSSQAIFGSISHRMIQAYGPRVYFSDVGRPGLYQTTNYHQIEGDMLGLANLRDVLLVFTTTGVYAISGLANELTDDQGNPLQRLEIVNRDLTLWHRTGIASWRGVLLIPALDGVWLLDSVSSPTKISAAVNDLYRSYVKTAGYRPGKAEVHNNHYFLPIIDASANVVDTLVCRLTDTRSGGPNAWARLAGSGANVVAYAVRAPTASAAPELLGAGRDTPSRVLSLAHFTPTAGTKNDHDGTTHQLELQTGDLSTGSPTVKSIVRFVKGFYELVDAGTDNPTIELAYQTEGESTWHVVSGSAPEGDGSDPYTWLLGKYAKRIRFRVRSQGPSAFLRLKTLQAYVRRSGGQ